MKEVIKNLLGFIYSFSMGDYLFFIGTFLLIILFIYVLYLIKLSDMEEEKKTEESKFVKNDEFDLEAVTKAIEKDYKPETIRLTSYEVEQEQNAIISYEELLSKKNTIGLDYDDEYSSEIPEISIKKINITSDLTKIEDEPKLEVKLIEYDKEEAFLKALKELQEKLSH